MNYITKHHASDSGYITLCDLTLTGLPNTIELRSETLFLKSELHISLVCLKRLAPMICPEDPKKATAELTEAFLEYSKTNPLDDYALTGEYYEVDADERKTVIAVCNLPDLDGLFEFLNKRFNSKLPTQPAHITLYTLQPEKGIGILSEDELHEIGQPVALEALSNVGT